MQGGNGGIDALGIPATGGSSYANPSSICGPEFAVAAGPGDGSVTVTLLGAT